MKQRNIIIYTISIILIYLKTFLFSTSNIFTYYIYPAIWLVFSIIISITNIKRKRIKNETEMIKSSIIFSITYIIVYFLLGLLNGFESSIYDHKLLSIIKNFNAFILIIVYYELIRQALITNSNFSKLQCVFITILLILLNLDITDNIKSFEYILKTVFPTIIIQILLTYFTFVGGIKTTLSYILPMEFIYIITPVFPNLDWYIYSVFLIVFNFLVYIFFDHEYKKRNNKLPMNSIHSSSPLKKLPYALLLILLAMYVIGFFSTSPIAIMSNSMNNIFYRGDIAIVKKVSVDEIKNIKKGDIIEYSLDDNIIIHRVIDVSVSIKNEYIFRTKGDNNNSPDSKLVHESQIMGILIFVIPKLGYPSVIFSDLIN